MRAARLHGARDVRIHDEERPNPGPGEALVRVEAVGLCGSDLHWFEEGAIGGTALARPIVPGHEMAGRTEDGQLVAIEPSIPCGAARCASRATRTSAPRSASPATATDDGSLREWMAWPRHCLIPLPEGLTAADGAMLEPLGVALHTVDLAHVRPGIDRRRLRQRPDRPLHPAGREAAGAARLYATDLASPPAPARGGASPRRRGLPRRRDEARAIATAAAGFGLDVAIEAAGIQAAVDAAVEAVRPGGRVVLAGIPSDERTSFTASTARRKGLTISWCGA